MHKLCGSAGMLGANLIHQLAIEIEAACAALDNDEVMRLTRRLVEELRRLASSYRSLPVRSATESETGLPSAGDDVDRTLLSELIALLRQQNLGALERFNALSPQLRRHMGEVPFGVARGHVDGLQFHAAADALAVLRH